MTIQSIKYWDSTISQTKNENRDEISKAFDTYKTSFNTTLFDILSGSKTQSLWGSSIPGLANDPFSGGYDMTAINKEIATAKEMGMEKVLAERLKAPLPFMNANNNSYNKGSSNPLDRMTELTMQLHLAKAKRVINNQNNHSLYSFEEFVGKVKINEDQVDSKENSSLKSLSNQIEDLAKTFGVSYTEVLKRLENDD